jgi:hypothetical protein
MRFHSKVPLVALFARTHLGVARLAFVLGGYGCYNQRGVHDCAGLWQQTALAQSLVDHRQDLFGELVPFEPMAKAQNGELFGQAGKFTQHGKIPVQRHVKKRFFHGGSDKANHCCCAGKYAAPFPTKTVPFTQLATAQETSHGGA